MGSYPLPKYHFKVDWGGAQTSFAEVSGLSIEINVIEYRDGNMPEQSTVKMPGLKKFPNLILKRGVKKHDDDFYKWINTIQQSAVERRDVVISLLDETHSPMMTWRVRNAWPCKYQVADLNASSNEVLIETLELAHEGFSIVS